jgi:[ribosomal protein S18]-alanine N-acetyltransferase
MSALPQSRDVSPKVIESKLEATSEPKIDKMQDSDLDAVMQIEQLSFRAPWSRQVFLEELSRPWAFLDVLRAPDERSRDGQKRDSSRTPSRVVGFCNYWRVADEIHILKVAIHPDARRSGFGSRLLAHILDFSRKHRCRLVTLEVRRSNEPAQRVYRRFGFKAVGLRPSYYADDNEDAVVMLLEM